MQEAFQEGQHCNGKEGSLLLEVERALGTVGVGVNHLWGALEVEGEMGRVVGEKGLGYRNPR